MKTAVVYGAGNIGRGFIGQLFSLSGYNVAFLDINKEVIDRLNVDRKYPVIIAKPDGYIEETVNNVYGINSLETEEVVGVISTCDIMATSIGVNILPKIVPNVAKGIIKRWENGNDKPLNIIICENLIDANIFLFELLVKEIGEEYREKINKSVGFVEASIGRMVPVMTEKMKEGNPLRVYVEEFSSLPVDKDAFRGDIPNIVNMVPFSPFAFYIERKLYMHNMGHALCAYLGNIKGYEYIFECCENSDIKLCVLRALLESSIAMSKENNVDMDELYKHVEDLIYRFSNRLLGDTVHRVGRDTKRKLSYNDRLCGAARLCLKHEVKPVYTAIGIAAGLVFGLKGDPGTTEVQDMIKTKGLNYTVIEICGLEEDSELIPIIQKYYELIKQKKEFSYIIKEAEKDKNIYTHKT